VLPLCSTWPLEVITCVTTADTVPDCAAKPTVDQQQAVRAKVTAIAPAVKY